MIKFLLNTDQQPALPFFSMYFFIMVLTSDYIAQKNKKKMKKNTALARMVLLVSAYIKVYCATVSFYMPDGNEECISMFSSNWLPCCKRY